MGKNYNGVIIDGGNLSRIFFINSSANVTFINLKFMNGNSDAGGAITSQGYIHVDRCIFTNNYAGVAGGAIATTKNNETANSIISNCIFYDNNAGRLGGAISNGAKDLIINNCSFNNNSAEFGGAVSTGGSVIKVTKSSFTANHAGSGGGALITDFDAYIDNCVFKNNYVTDSDGGAGAIGVIMYSKFRVNNCVFINNSAYEGGAIYIEANDSVISKCIFINNYADYGGAIIDIGNKTVIYNNTFIKNHGRFSGGAIYCKRESNLSIINSSNFIYNYAPSGGAIANFGNELRANYNRFSNNSNTVFDNTSNSFYDYCWWGSNRPPKGINIHNYFIANVVLVYNKAINGIIKLDYKMILNTDDTFDLNRLPDFKGFTLINEGLLPGNSFNPKLNQIITLNGGNLLNKIRYSVVIDNEKLDFNLINIRELKDLIDIKTSQNGNKLTISVFILNKDFNVPLKGIPFKLLINGKTHILSTDGNGYATFTYKVNKKEKLNLKAVLPLTFVSDTYGDILHLGATTSKSINVQPNSDKKPKFKKTIKIKKASSFKKYRKYKKDSILIVNMKNIGNKKGSKSISISLKTKKLKDFKYLKTLYKQFASLKYNKKTKSINIKFTLYPNKSGKAYILLKPNKS
jgi:predicted outer membrane repeat protein